MIKKVLAFDFGGSSGRALLGNLKEGKLVYKEIARFDNIPIIINGIKHWNFENLQKNVKDAIKIAGKLGFDAIGIDTWGVDYGLLDMDGNLISPPVQYRDDRTILAKQEVNKLISEEQLYNITGIQDMRINTVYQLYSDKMAGKLENVSKFLFMPDLFANMLCGSEVCEYSIATTSAMIESLSKNWSEEIIETLGFPKHIFPEIISSGQTYGMLKKSLCDELGIKSVPIIAVCGHDTASAIMAVPSKNQSDIYISCGTWSLMGTLSDAPRFENPYFTNEGGAQNKITYLSNIMGLWIMQEVKRVWSAETPKINYKIMDDYMLECTNNDYFINPNAECFVAPDNMVDAIQNYLMEHGNINTLNKGDIVRCIYNSLALSYRYTYEELSGSNDIFVIGGGTKAPPLCQITADATGQIVHGGPVEATAIGNILTILIALGETTFSDCKDIIFNTEAIATYYPNKDKKEEYDHYYQQFKKLI